MNKRRGFTLVELLIVIGIILALLSILLPAMTSARHQAKSVTCLANLRVLQLAFVNYVGNENDGRSFDYTQTTAVPVPIRPYITTSWLADLRRAGASDSARICPEAIDIGPLAGTSGSGGVAQSWTYNPQALPQTTTGQYTGSYAINGWLYTYNAAAILGGLPSSTLMPPPQSNYIPFNQASKPRPPVPPTSVPLSSTSVPVFCDSVWVETFPTGADLPDPMLQPNPMTAPGAPAINTICINRHHKAINVVFLDGSATTVQLSELWTLPWSNNYQPPTAAQLTAIQATIAAAP